MKQFFLLGAILCVVNIACKTKHEVSKSNTTEIATPKGASFGKVSHQYRAGGCATVVLVYENNNLNGKLVIIPMNPLPQGIDVDGLEIYFDYRTLKMPNPNGCSVGIPAELKNVSKK